MLQVKFDENITNTGVADGLKSFFSLKFCTESGFRM